MQSIASPNLRLDKARGHSLLQTTLELPPGLHTVWAKDTLGQEELFAWLCGLQSPRRGKLTLRDREPCRDPDLRRHIASLLPHEQLPHAASVSMALERIGVDDRQLSATTDILECLGSRHLLTLETHKLTPQEHRRVALALALATEEPFAVVLHEPLSALNQDGRSYMLDRIVQHATRIPVLIVSANVEFAARLDGPTLVLESGMFRAFAGTRANRFALRIVGIGMRTVASELAKRPLVDGLTLTTLPNGHEELSVRTNAPDVLSLDVVRIIQETGIRLIALQCTEVPG